MLELPINSTCLFIIIGGEGGIRTPGTLASPTVFKTAAFDRSATSPLCFFDTLRKKYAILNFKKATAFSFRKALLLYLKFY